MDDILFEKFLNDFNPSTNAEDDHMPFFLSESTGDEYDFLSDEQLSDAFFESLTTELDSGLFADNTASELFEFSTQTSNVGEVDTFLFDNDLPDTLFFEPEQILSIIDDTNIFENNDS